MCYEILFCAETGYQMFLKFKQTWKVVGSLRIGQHPTELQVCAEEHDPWILSSSSDSFQRRGDFPKWLQKTFTIQTLEDFSFVDQNILVIQKQRLNQGKKKVPMLVETFFVYVEFLTPKLVYYPSLFSLNELFVRLDFTSKVLLRKAECENFWRPSVFFFQLSDDVCAKLFHPQSIETSPSLSEGKSCWFSY